MSTKNDGGPAFPVNENCADGAHHQTFMGMTLRDWFAGKAMVAMVSRLVEVDGSMTNRAVEAATDGAYFIADQMLRARGE